LGLHDKPVLLLNVNGFWDPLIGLLDHVIAEGFAEGSLKGFVTVVDDVDQAVTALRSALP
jgi:predicted Rossmann-fold nucleotide-binding protein